MISKIGILTFCISILTLAGACQLSAKSPPPTALTAPAQDSHEGALPLTRASAGRMTSAQLAYRLLPSQLAGRIVSHEIAEPTFPGGPLRSVDFFARPVPLGNDLCQRDVVYVSFEPIGGATAENLRQDVPVETDGIAPKVQIAAAPQCRLQGGLFAWVQPERALSGAAGALRRLLSLRAKARSGALSSVNLTCRSEHQQDVCNRSARSLLANLPLNKIYIIEPRETGWEFSVMPTGPGGEPYWEVILGAEGEAEQKIELSWGVPPPF